MMKKLFLQKYFFITFIALLAFSAGATALFYHIMFWINATQFSYVFILPILCAIYFFLAYLVGDIDIIRYRKKNGLVISTTPKEILEKAKVKRIPFIVMAIVLLVVFAIFYIVYLRSGNWPFI